MKWSRRAGIVLVASAVIGTALSVPASAHETEAYSHESGTGASNPDWMRRLPDSARFTELTLPGTHDSGAYREGGDSALTQTMNLRTQLDAGIRAWDIRLSMEHAEKLTVFHGFVRQGQDFDTEVLGAADDFLAAHPFETVFMRVRNEIGESNGFRDLLRTVLDRHPRVYRGADRNPALRDVRGRVVVLDNVTSDAEFGIPWGALSKQDDYDLTTNWDLATKWRAVRTHLDAAETGSKTRGYVNFLSGSGGSFPYFVASGHSSPQTGAPNLLTGWTRGVIDTCGGSSRCIDEFRGVDCFLGTCSVVFEGVNVLTTDRILSKPWRARYGIVYADFPGRSLIHAVYNSNDFHGVLRGQDSGRCVDVPSYSQVDATPVQLWDCVGVDNQTWLAASDDQFKLLGTTKCLDVRGGSTADGAVVQSYQCNGTGAQKWYVNVGGSFVNTASGKCLEAVGRGTGNGVGLVVNTCHGGSSQRWSRR